MCVRMYKYGSRQLKQRVTDIFCGGGGGVNPSPCRFFGIAIISFLTRSFSDTAFLPILTVFWNTKGPIYGNFRLSVFEIPCNLLENLEKSVCTCTFCHFLKTFPNINIFIKYKKQKKVPRHTKPFRFMYPTADISTLTRSFR